MAGTFDTDDFTESPFFAGVLFYLSKWYTKSELNLRMSIFYSGSLISGAFGSLIAAGILSGLDGAMGMAAWQWLVSLFPAPKYRSCRCPCVAHSRSKYQPLRNLFILNHSSSTSISLLDYTRLTSFHHSISLKGLSPSPSASSYALFSQTSRKPGAYSLLR